VSLESQLVQPLVIIDQENNRSFPPGPEWGLGVETETSKWTLFLFPGTAIFTGDRVQRGAVIFEVMGEPEPFDARGVPHHIECNLRTVAGGN
jgi:hypothetical protein